MTLLFCFTKLNYKVINAKDKNNLLYNKTALFNVIDNEKSYQNRMAKLRKNTQNFNCSILILNNMKQF